MLYGVKVDVGFENKYCEKTSGMRIFGSMIERVLTGRMYFTCIVDMWGHPGVDGVLQNDMS